MAAKAPDIVPAKKRNAFVSNSNMFENLILNSLVLEKNGPRFINASMDSVRTTYITTGDLNELLFVNFLFFN